jgi:ABC-type branched-subunit amino acid transport system ATPase component
MRDKQDWRLIISFYSSTCRGNFTIRGKHPGSPRPPTIMAVVHPLMFRDANLIGIVGDCGAGKDTVANILFSCQDHPRANKRLSMGDLYMLPRMGATTWYSTGRASRGQLFWENVLDEHALQRQHRTILTDIRYPAEARAVMNNGGIIIIVDAGKRIGNGFESAKSMIINARCSKVVAAILSSLHPRMILLDNNGTEERLRNDIKSLSETMRRRSYTL